MMEAVSSSETLVSIYQTTWYSIPEHSYLYTYHCKNLKSHKVCNFFQELLQLIKL
jgi:hypothetical protein